MPRWSRSPLPSRSRWHAERPVAIGAALAQLPPPSTAQPRPTNPIAPRQLRRGSLGCKPPRHGSASISPHPGPPPSTHHSVQPPSRYTAPARMCPVRASPSARRSASGLRGDPVSLAAAGNGLAKIPCPTLRLSVKRRRSTVCRSTTPPPCAEASLMVAATERGESAVARSGQQIRPSGSVRAAGIPPDRLTVPGGTASSMRSSLRDLAEPFVEPDFHARRDCPPVRPDGVVTPDA